MLPNMIEIEEGLKNLRERFSAREKESDFNNQLYREAGNSIILAENHLKSKALAIFDLEAAIEDIEGAAVFVRRLDFLAHYTLKYMAGAVRAEVHRMMMEK